MGIDIKNKVCLI